MRRTYACVCKSEPSIRLAISAGTRSGTEHELTILQVFVQVREFGAVAVVESEHKLRIAVQQRWNRVG